MICTATTLVYYNVKKVDSAVKPRWSLWDDISVEDGIVLLGGCMIVPRSLKGNILQQIHGGHFSMGKCKLQAKSCVYWPGIYTDLERLIISYNILQKYQNSHQKEPMAPSEIPSRLWQTVSADLFYAQQSGFLIVVDYYSKFLFDRKLHSLRAGAVAIATRVLFTRNGIPKTLCCNNGTQVTSSEFQQFSSQPGFEIVMSSPHYPHGHDFVWRQVQMVKRTILKCRKTGEGIDLALLTLWTMPLSFNVPSPAELLNDWLFKSTLPGKIYLARNQEEFLNWLRVRQDRHAKELPDLHKDQAVYVQDPLRKMWSPAKVVDQGGTP